MSSLDFNFNCVKFFLFIPIHMQSVFFLIDALPSCHHDFIFSLPLNVCIFVKYSINTVANTELLQVLFPQRLH